MIGALFQFMYKHLLLKISDVPFALQIVLFYVPFQNHFVQSFQSS
jgi:hypothetical protein